MAIEKYLGLYFVRDLLENETYFCHEGCGSCKKSLVIENNEVVRSKEGVLEKRSYSKVEVSSCCHSSIGIWNEDKDEEVHVEYQFAPSEE